MTGKHRNFVFKPEYVYQVGAKLKLERIVSRNKNMYKSLVQVSAKKGNVRDVYILQAENPSGHLGSLVEVERVDRDFMRNTYYLRPVNDKGKVRRPSY